jgi:hypothetical protein
MKPLTAEWAEKAEGDFLVATQIMKRSKNRVLDAACFDCQQTSEMQLPFGTLARRRPLVQPSAGLAPPHPPASGIEPHPGAPSAGSSVVPAAKRAVLRWCRREPTSQIAPTDPETTTDEEPKTQFLICGHLRICEVESRRSESLPWTVRLALRQPTRLARAAGSPLWDGKSQVAVEASPPICGQCGSGGSCRDDPPPGKARCNPVRAPARAGPAG